MSTFLPAVFGENLMDVFDDFDRAFFRGMNQPEHMLYGKNASHMMKTDVKETDEGYEVDVDLPGFKKDEIKLELNNGYLTISTEKSLEKKDEKKGKILRQERYSGTMQRTFYVGDSMTEELNELVFGIMQLSSDLEKHAILEEKVLIPYMNQILNASSHETKD